jgi:lysophospholipase L1-like esterase
MNTSTKISINNNFASLLVIVLILSSCIKKDVTLATMLNNKGVNGESIALFGERPSYLLKKDAEIKKVYQIDKNGDTTIFKNGFDYIAVIGGGLKRTPKSRIPDFYEHKMIINSKGLFTWQPEPNRNPQLSYPWQIMVDYDTRINPSIAAKGMLITRELKNKIENKNKISIQCIGTSITAGAHTLPQVHDGSDEAVYVHLIAKAIKNLYGNEVSVNNLSIGGASTSLFISQLDFLISEDPDIVFIEFGMNEHLIGADMDTNLSHIEIGVKSLKSKGINCVLVGFFQQNPQWEKEDPALTIYFNNKLREMANRNNVFFADIYTLFNSLPKEKIYRDLMGDYHHHPTGFGHQLYYLKTVPFILFTNRKESELLGLIKYN